MRIQIAAYEETGVLQNVFTCGHPSSDWLLSTTVDLFLVMYKQVASHMHYYLEPLKTLKKMDRAHPTHPTP